MNRTIRRMVTLLALSGCVCCGNSSLAVEPSEPIVRQLASRSLQRGVGWLVSQQAADGGWHSKTYGTMKGGVGNTALILSALSPVPQSTNKDVQAAFERGARFLTTNLDEHGLVQAPDGSADYPVYATALLLTALERRSPAQSHAEQQRMCSGLLKAQRSSKNGWSQDHPDFGGWGIIE